MQPNKLLKKIGTGQFGKNGAAREDATEQLDSLRNSLGPNSTLARNQILNNRYEIEQVIGYGGMSTVYRARDLHFKQMIRVCAVKEMFDQSNDPASRKDKLARFEMEANMLASLNHISIPKIYDFFTVNDRSYLVLEYIDGKNLESVLEDQGGPIDEDLVIEWALQIVDVLRYLHHHKPNPIVFRDMKPSNVMLNSDGRLRLIDFGIAKVFMDEKKGTMIGTEGYSPPEQYKGLALPVGDIYALGATLHQLLTNSDPRLEIPFTFHERLPRQLNPVISPEMETLVMKSLEYLPENRFRSIEELQAGLKKLKDRQNPEPVVGLSAGDGTRQLDDKTLDLQIEVARQAGVTGYNPTIKPAPELPPATPATNNRRSQTTVNANAKFIPNNLPSNKQLWSFMAEEELRSSPVVANNTVYIGSYDSNIYALDAKNGQFIWKAATNAGISSSPAVTDNLVIVGSEDNRLYAFDVARGNKIWELPTGGPVRSSPRLYNNFAFFGSDDNHIYAVDIRTGKQLWKQRTSGPVRSSACIMNGVVYIGSSDRRLYALEASKGQITWKYETLNSITSSPYFFENQLYVGSDDSYLYCFDALNGYPAWKEKTGKMVKSSPTVYAGKVYFGSHDGILYCLDAKKGRKMWTLDTGSQIVSSPRVESGRVIIGTSDGNIYAIEAEKGEAEWFFQTDGPIVSTPFISNDIVYIGSNDKKLYALALKPGN